MQVSCPHCATRYVLPESLLGPLGARVRCPRCREAFTVDPPAPADPPGPPAVAVAEGAPGIATSPPGTDDDSPSEWSRRIDAEPPPSPGSRTPSAAPKSLDDDQAFRTQGQAPAHRQDPPAVSPSGAASRAIDAHEVARAVLDGIESGGGEGVAEAWAQGHLFAEYGQAIGEAYENYRRQLGPGADPAAFRAALRERWGVDLEPGTPVTT
jgi:predicted Zn finger-like uncharacterized protein